MAFIKSLRAKVLLSALIPTVLVLVAVAVIALYAYEREARDVILQRDTELAKISAARLSEGLAQHSRILQTTATDEDVQSLEPARMRQALERVQSRLFVFDAGVVIYNDEGVAVWSDPFSFERRGKGIPVPSAFDQVRRAERPHFSDVFKDTYSDEHAIMLAVPIIASGREFMGVLVGMSTLKSLRSNAAFPQVLEITAGRKGFAYLVDGKGVVIHHRDSSEFATDLSSTVPVMGAIGGENGAVITKDSAGETVISGFAPVPGTSWGVITQERWESVVGPIRDYSKLLLGLLVLGGILSGGLIVFAVGRCLKPIKDVTRGAQRIAGGDFDHAITAKTGDEIQALAQQFNTMASALKESYSDLEQKVEARTEEVRESEERLRRAQQAGRLGTWDWNVLTNTLIWDGVEPIHGLEPGAFGGSFDAYVRDIHPEDQNTVMATISQAAEQGHGVGDGVPDYLARWQLALGPWQGKSVPKRERSDCAYGRHMPGHH